MRDRQNLASLGENIAKQYLRDRGYVIRECNWRCKIGELDIIATIFNLTVFVEVKTKTSTSYGYPEDMVHARKRRKLTQLVDAYCKQKNIKDNYQLDVIAILINGSKAIIRHIKNIEID